MSDLESNGTNKNAPNLSTSRIIGTSAKSTNQFILQGDLVAYTASGGVVVCQIDQVTNEIISQRFFCANNSYTCPDTTKDNFGYPMDSPMVIGSDSSCSSSDDLHASPSKLQNKVRTINCIAISPNRKLLALGEVGYSPRILIFSLAPNSSQNPIVLIYEHSFGISSVVFSPDSKWLCSLGVVNDGYINVWKLNGNQVSLSASNRCSSVINKVIWHENMIITLGLRILKVWKFEIHVKSNILRGKNVILGNLIHANFLDACVVNDEEVLVISNNNQFLLLKLSSEVKIYCLQGPEVEFGSIDYDLEKVWFGTNDYKVTNMDISKLVQIEVASNGSPRRVNMLSPSKEMTTPVKPIIKLVNFSTRKLLMLNDKEQIKFIDKVTNEETVLAQSIIKDIAGITEINGSFLAFSKQGSIKRITDFKSNDLINFKLSNGGIISNSITTIQEFNNKLIIGDKYGGLYVIQVNQADYNILFQTKAHSSSINQIIAFTFENIEMICTIGRDRMIQFFQNNSNNFELIETVPIHQGNLLKVLYNQNKVYVCSSDRTISIHTLYKQDSIKINLDKVITLKATPITMKIYNNELIVSQSDKTLQIYDLDSVEFKKSIRYVNSQTNEFIQVENFIKYDNYLITWSTDKSLRVFKYDGGNELCVVWGHSDNILGLFMHKDKLVSVGCDGCLFTWNLSRTISEWNESSSPDMIMRSVTRKILPRSPEKRSLEKSERATPILSPPKTLRRRSSTPNFVARLTASNTTATAAKLQSPLRTISPNKPSTPTYKKLPHVVLNDQSNTVDGILNRLDEIKRKLPGLSVNDKKLVNDKLIEMLELFGEPQQDMLEKYSDLLVGMVEKKLKLNE